MAKKKLRSRRPASTKAVKGRGGPIPPWLFYALIGLVVVLAGVFVVWIVAHPPMMQQ